MRTAPLEMGPASALAAEPLDPFSASDPVMHGAPGDDGCPELRRSRIAPALCALDRVLGGALRPGVAGVLFGALARLEGGVARSWSVRALLLSGFGVTVGAYSHGAGLRPGALPPGVIVGRYTTIAAGVRVIPADFASDHVATHAMFRAAGTDPDAAAVGGVGGPAGGRRAARGWSRLVIGHDVWIGTGVVIADTCARIGNGSVVADGSTVTEDVPPFTIVAGAPARVVRARFAPEVARLVAASRWWDRGAAEAAEVLASLRQVAAAAWPAQALSRA